MVVSPPGQSKPAAGVSSDRLPSQSRLADHQTSAALPSPTTALQQPSAVSHAHSPAQTGASLQPHEAQPESHLVAQAVAQPATHSEPGQSRVSGEPSVVAAIKEQTLPALVQSSNASEDSKNENVPNAQNVAANDGIQAMDLDEDTTGTKGRPPQAALCVATLSVTACEHTSLWGSRSWHCLPVSVYGFFRYQCEANHHMLVSGGILCLSA